MSSLKVAALEKRKANLGIHARNYEENLSAEQCSPQKDSWLSCQDGNSGWAQGTQAPTSQGSPSPDGDNSAKAARVISTPDASFGKRHRLRRRRDFLAVQREGVKLRTQHFLLEMVADFADEGPKLGLTVSRRVGKPVVRNRLKRRLRESFRLTLKHMLPERAALVVVAHADAGALDFATINAELTAGVRRLLRKSRL